MSANTRDLISGLYKPRRGKQKTKSLKPGTKIVPKAGKGSPSSGLGGGGGSFPSKLMEVPGSRTYYSDLVELRSTDGALVLLYQNVYSMKFKTSEGAVVQFLFDNDLTP